MHTKSTVAGLMAYRLIGLLLLVVPVLILLASSSPLAGPEDDDAIIADSLANMLRAARQVISSSQAKINDPDLGDKGLSGQVVLQQSIEVFKKSTGSIRARDSGGCSARKWIP
jgi:hypothetical protein